MAFLIGKLAAPLFLLAFAGFFVFRPSFLDDSGVLIFSEKFLEPEKITLLAVGDIMLDRGVEFAIQKQGRGDFSFPFIFIKPELEKEDLLFGNLENVISDKGHKVGSVYSFRANSVAIDGLKYAGFDVLNLAHNHSFDYTASALEDTMARLEAVGIDYVGAGKNVERAFGLVIKEVKGAKIGFLGFTNLGPSNWKAAEDRTGIAWIEKGDFSFVGDLIKQAKTKVNILVVSLHAGVEYSAIPNDFQKEFAHFCVDSGADLIIGHHTHVVQTQEQYKNRWIVYGLGNFIFDQFFSEETMKGGLLEVLIENKKIKNVQLKQVKLNSFYQPELIE